MATAPYSFPHPSAATYPPPPFPGGYDLPSPFPYPAPVSGFVPAPAFPYAATYPPPASVYSTPTSHGFPVPAYGPSTFVPPPPSPPPAYPYLPPVSAYAPAPAFPSPISTQFEPNQPAPPTTGAPFLSATPERALLSHPNQVTSATLTSGRSSPTPWLLDAIPTAPNQERQPPRCHASSTSALHPIFPTNNEPNWSSHAPDPTPSTHHFLLDPSPTLDLEKSNGWQPEFQQGANSDSPALHVFDGMPTPIPCGRSSTPPWLLDTVRTPPTREHTPLQSSFDSLHGELSKLSAAVSQFAAVMGLQTTETLVTSSSPVAPTQFRSPGNTTSRSYMGASASSSVNSFHSRSDASASAYVAPEVFGDMPTPISWQGTDVTAPNYFSGHHDPIQSTFVCNISEQNLDGRPQANGLHNLNCKSVVPEPMFAVYDESDSSSTESVPLFTGTPEKLTGEEDNPETEQTSKYSRKASKNEIPSQQPPMSSTATDHMQFQAFENMPKFDEYAEEDSACLNIITEVHDFTLELQPTDDGRSSNCPVLKTSDSYVTRSSQLSVVRSVTEMRLLWDPGDTTFYALFTTADSATKLQCTNVYKPAVVQILAVQFGVRRVLILKSAVMHCDAFGLARTKVNGSAMFIPVVPGSADTSCSSPSFENMAKLLWDPGIGISSYMYLWPEMRAVKMLGKTAVANLVHSGQTPCNLRNFLGHPVDLKQVGTQLLPCLPWSQIPNAFLEVQYCCLPFILDCSYSEPIQQLVCYSRMFSSTEALLSAICMSISSTLFMILVLSFEEIAEGTDGAALYQISIIQLPMRNTTHVWNIGIDSLLLVYIWRHIQKTKLVNCTSKATQSAKWTSTSPNSITSSELNSIIDRWEFIHAQGV